MTGDVRIGTSGWVYPPWRGVFYPKGLTHKRELEYLSHEFDSVEINGSFYSLQRPESYQRWAEQTPDDFVFSVKGPRFITHMKRLKDAETPLANFFASGVLALNRKLGPILWQLPATFPYDPEILTTFFTQLPRSTKAAATLSKQHDSRLNDRAWTKTDNDRPIRHALEVRGQGFQTKEFINLLREHDIALVVADAAGTWPHMEDVTSDFIYIRLHGDKELYTSGYTNTALDNWATKIKTWRSGKNVHNEYTTATPAPYLSKGRDVYIYFDNDTKVKAPKDAKSLAARLE